MTKPRSDAPGASDYGLLGLLALIYGSAFLFTKFAVQGVAPELVVFTRLLIALVIFLPLAVLGGQTLRFPPAVWGWLLASGLFGNALPFWLISWGQQEVDSGLAAILMAPMPLATLVIAHFATDDEPLIARKLWGILLGMTGVIVLVGIKSLNQIGNDLVRQLAILGAGTCYAINAVITRRYTHLPTRSVLAAVMACSILWMAPLAMSTDLSNQTFSAASTMSIVILGLVQTAFGALLAFTLVQRQGAGFFGQINILVPLIGAFLGAVLLSEPLGWEAWLALALILAGILISRGTKKMHARSDFAKPANK